MWNWESLLNIRMKWSLESQVMEGFMILLNVRKCCNIMKLSFASLIRPHPWPQFEIWAEGELLAISAWFFLKPNVCLVLKMQCHSQYGGSPLLTSLLSMLWYIAMQRMIDRISQMWKLVLCIGNYIEDC